MKNLKGKKERRKENETRENMMGREREGGGEIINKRKKEKSGC